MITFKNKYDGSLVMSQQTHAQEVTSHSPVARLVTIGHFQSEQSLVVVAQWEEHALSVSTIFNIQTLALRYREHICCFIYQQSKIHKNLEYTRSAIYLRSTRKIKFKTNKKRRYERYLRSLKVRGVKLWEMLPIDVQRATTKVKLKNLIKKI